MNYNSCESKFLRTIHHVLHNGQLRPTRTGVLARSVFDVHLKFSLANNILPLLTSRRLPLRSIFEELMWFIRGQTDAKILASKNVNVWNANTSRGFLNDRGLSYYQVGDIGPSYSFQFRYAGAPYRGCDYKNYSTMGEDQLKNVIDTITHDPNSRRMLISLWNVSDLKDMALVPCGFCYQFYVDIQNKRLSCKVIQRSSDIALAGGWNVASASLLVIFIAKMTGLTPHELIWTVGDCHIYVDQIKGVEEQLRRKPVPFPTLEVLKPLVTMKDLESLEFEDLVLKNYNPYPPIKIPMSV